MDILLQSGMYGYITSPYVVWLPVAVAAALAVIGILAVMYALSSFTGNRRIAVWTRAKIYEVLIGFVLIGAFLFLVLVFTSINFVQLFNGIGLVPPSCTQPPSNDLFTLAVCDMYTFNHNITYMNYAVYFIGARLAFIPTLSVKTPPVPGIEGLSVGTSVTVVPRADEVFLGYALSALYTAFMLTHLELLLLAAAMLIFSLFMAIGLVSRMFVITRSFGGALIAFAIGLGIVYPLMVSITYGYVDVGLSKTIVTFVTTALAGSIGGILGLFVFSGIPALVSGGFAADVAGFIGMALLGLILIPLLNFVIVDVFIIDFSSAVGEKMDLMSLLGGLV